MNLVCVCVSNSEDPFFYLRTPPPKPKWVPSSTRLPASRRHPTPSSRRHRADAIEPSGFARLMPRDWVTGLSLALILVLLQVFAYYRIGRFGGGFSVGKEAASVCLFFWRVEHFSGVHGVLDGFEAETQPTTQTDPEPTQSQPQADPNPTRS